MFSLGTSLFHSGLVPQLPVRFYFCLPLEGKTIKLQKPLNTFQDNTGENVGNDPRAFRRVKSASTRGFPFQSSRKPVRHQPGGGTGAEVASFVRILHPFDREMEGLAKASPGSRFPAEACPWPAGGRASGPGSLERRFRALSASFSVKERDGKSRSRPLSIQESLGGLSPPPLPPHPKREEAFGVQTVRFGASRSLPFKTAEATPANNGKWLPLGGQSLPPLP